MRELCFATGNLYRFLREINVLDLVSKLNVDGVEYTFGKDFFEREITKRDYEILNSFDFVSFHWPFRLSLEKFSKTEFLRQFYLIQSAYLKSKASQIVIHPGISLDYSLLDSGKMFFLTENLNPKPMIERPRLGFEADLNRNENWGLCLDVNHAYNWSGEETGEIVSKWKNRIKQIHFSNNFYGKDHVGFKKVSRAFLSSIEPVLSLNVPFIIEEDMKDSSLGEVKKEVARIKDILGFN